MAFMLLSQCWRCRAFTWHDCLSYNIACARVPVESKSLKGMDSSLSIVQMPAGIPVGTLAIGVAGVQNAALLAAQILSLSDDSIGKALAEWR